MNIQNRFSTMTNLHKLVLVFLGVLLHFSVYAISNSTYFPANTSPPSFFTCPTDSLEVFIQSTSTCSRTPIEFQTNLLNTNLTWDYGDGASDNGLANGHATHIYLATGNYTVQVTADYGADCTETQTINLKVVTSELDFTYQIIDKTVTFTAITNEFTAINRYKWTLGDGASASGLTPTTVYTYRKNGEYVVSLVGEGDCSTPPTTKTIQVGAAPIPEDSPSACNDGIDNDGDGKIDCEDSECECICTSGAFGCCDDFTAKVNLIHATPGKMDGSIDIIPSGGSDKAENYQVVWAITPAPTGFTATNLAPGDYTLEVIDLVYGCTLFIERTITADDCRNSTMVANVDITSQAACDTPNGQATVNQIGGAGPFDYLWSNGATSKSVSNLAIGTQSVQITDANGCVTTETFEMPSTNQPVTAIFDYTLTTDSIVFRDLSVGPVDSKQWTFNTPSLILNNRTPLPPPGSYEICLIIKNECGGTSTSCQTLGIAPACAAEVLTINVIDAQSEYCVRAPVLFETNVLAENYTWYFGDANTFTGTESAASGSSLNSTSHIYFEAAEPSIKLVVDYGNGCVDSTAIDLSIVSTDTDFSFTMMGDSALFIADSSVHITDCQWTFSGPNTATTAYGHQVNFTFPETGEYTVSLMPMGSCNALISQKIVLFSSTFTPENTPRACSDGIDNDGDGLLDCDDLECPCETCPTDIEFFSQIDVDNFPISYPECTAIEGNVTIQSLDSDINNLEALGQLTAIGGTLLIIENPALTSLSGLNDIMSIGGDLELDQNPLLTNLHGLNELSSIDGTFAIGEQSNLSQLFNSNTLFSIGGDFLLYGDTKLQNLSSLEALLLLGGALEITNQNTLQSLQGLENIGELGGSLLLTNNAQLNSLTALSPVNAINGELNVSNNPMLNSLAGLDNIDAGTITKITIQSSTALSYCAVTSVCNFLDAVGTAKISGNATGCSTTQEVITDCSETPTPPLFTEFPWLNNIVNPANCSTEKITKYLSNANQIYVFIETANSAVLYNSSGQTWCTNASNYECRDFYTVVEVLEVWECGTTTVIDADMDGTPASTDPDDNDPCVPDNTVANCDDGSNTDADMDGTPASTDPDDNDPCVPDNTVANCNTGGGTIPDFYTDYPWLNNLVDPLNCTDEKITIYKSSGFIYLAVETSSSLVLYNAQGTRYCTNGIGLNCLEYYTVDEVLQTWECGAMPPVQVDEDMDGVLAENDPDDTDPCVPNTSAVTCDTSVVGQRPIIFTDYPWLTDYVDPATCSMEDSIIVYRSSGYVYLFIKKSESGILYNAQGQQYCVSSPTYNCLALYKIDEYINIWTCQDNPSTPTDKDMDGTPAATDPDDNDPCVPDNTVANCDNSSGEVPAFFEDYTWLNNLVDPTSCTEEKITIYKSGGFIYLAIETETSLVLYNAQGTRYCSNGIGLNCLDYYSVDEILETWECGTSSTPIDLDMDGTPASTDPDDNDPCVPDNTVANCNDGSTTDADMDGTPAATDPDDNDPCVPDNTVANCNTTETPTLFTDYPWLNNQVDPNNCNGDAVTVYRSSGYVYLLVSSGNKSILYNAQGAQYCVSSANYDCTVLYAIDEVLDTWSCTTNEPITGDCANNVGNIRLIDCSDGTPFFFIELPNGTILDPYFQDGLSFDYFDGQTVNFDFYYADFFSPCYFVQGTIILTCIEQSEDCFCPDTNLPVCGTDGITYQNICEAQCAGVDILSETECGNSTPNFFIDFPWLADLVDPANCTTEKITVYRTGFYQYIWVETPESQKMYFQDGTLYCTEVPEFDCIAAYQLDRIDYQWSCSSSLTKGDIAQSRTATQNNTRTLEKELAGFSVFPNPSRGTCFIELTTTAFPQTISLMDISGQVFQTLPIAATASGSKELLPIDLTGVLPGIYFVQVASEQGNQTQRLVVK